MRSQVPIGLSLAVLAVALTSWWTVRSDQPDASRTWAPVVAAVIAAFAPSFVEWLLRRYRDRRRAREVHEPAPTATPAGLLRADQRVVPFTGRDRDYAELREWCRDRKSPVRLVIGPGGVGKTRLAVELGHYLTAAGWTVVQVSPGHETDALTRLRDTGRGPFLLVVDYAETRSGLAELLRSVVADPANVRVLLIARHDEEWWLRLRSDIPKVRQAINAYPPMKLTTELPAAPAELVSAAIPHFADRLGLAAPPRAAEVTVSGQLPLLVLHAAALVAVLRAARAEEPVAGEVTEHGVLGELLGHESRYWADRAGAEVPIEPAVRRRAVALACLFPARDEDDAAELLRRVPDLADAEEQARRSLARWLRGLYPADSGYWGSLQPELVAEHHVVDQLRDCPALVTSDPEELRPEQRRQMLTLLSRAAEHHADAEALLARLLRKHLPVLWEPALAVATAAGGGIVPALVEVLRDAPVEPALLRKIDEAIPYPTTKLTDLAETAARRAFESLPADLDPEPPAYRRERLGVLMAQAGHPIEALEQLERAVRDFRELTVANRPRYAPDLARCLHRRALRHAELDDLDTARADATEAVALYRKVGPTSGHQADFAACLHNLGGWTTEPERAVELLTEAVRHFRELAQEDRVAYLGQLHETQETLRRRESELPDSAEVSLDELRSTVESNRRRAERNPDMHRPDLAHALRTLGDRYVRLGEYRDAERALAEAVRVYRLLAEANPGRFRPGLAGCLNDLGVVLLRRERFAEAEQAIQRAIELHQELIKDRPVQTRPELARSLANLIEVRSGAGRHEDALELADQAVPLFEDLAELDPARYRLGLAEVLTNLGVCLSELRRHAEALPIAERSMDLHQQLHEEACERFHTARSSAEAERRAAERRRYAEGLALALDNVAVDLDGLGRHPEADDCRDRARLLREPFVEPAASGGADAPVLTHSPA